MANSVRRIRIANPALNISERTSLDSDYSSGSTITVTSNIGFADNDWAILGNPGDEKTEAQDVVSTTGYPTITLSGALAFTHSAGTPIYRSEFNRIEISVDTGSGWSVLSTIDIQWDKLETIYIHQGGVDSNSYRFRFYNSASGNYSEYSPTVAGSGYAKDQIGYRVARVRKLAKDKDKKIVSDDEIISFMCEAKDIIRAHKSNWWFWKKRSDGDITTVEATRTYNLDTVSETIEYLGNVYFTDSSGSEEVYYPLDYKPEAEWNSYLYDTSPTENDTVRRYTILEADADSNSGYIKVDPIPDVTGNGSFSFVYYAPDADYDDMSDTTSIPIPSILDDYALFRIEQIKGNDGKAKVYEEKFYGPTDLDKRRQRPTGIALLELWNSNKGRPINKPRALKLFKGRRAMARFYSSSFTVSRDPEREW